MGFHLDTNRGQKKQEGPFGRGGSVPAWNDKAMFSGCDVPKPAQEALRKLDYNGDPDTEYVEFQVFGPVDVATDVEAFVFKLGPPKGEHLAFLRAHGIPIFDGSKWPPKPWSPPDEG